MPLAARWWHLVLGVDVHWNPLPVPTPLPYPYVGVIWDPIGEGMGAAIGWLLDAPAPGPVKINGENAAITGHTATNWIVSPHIPWTGGWIFPTLPPPSGNADLPFGSQTVRIRSGQSVRQGDMALSCSDPISMPTSAVLCFAGVGGPVIVGGPTGTDGLVLGLSVGLQAARYLFSGTVLRLGFKASRRFGRAGRAFRSAVARARLARLTINRTIARVSRQLGQRARQAIARARCFVRGDPVDPATGRVLSEDTDFELPGPIPLIFKRHYDSSMSARDGVLGYGWSHSLDQAAWLELGQVVYRNEEGREIELPTYGLPGDVMHPGDELYDPRDRLTIRCKAAFTWEIESHPDGLVRELSRVTNRPDDQVAKLVRIRSRDGHEVRLVYDPKTGLLATVYDSCGRRVLFEHDERGKLVRVLLPDPKEEGHREHLSFAYSDRGDLAEARDALRQVTRYLYESHLLVQWTDRTGLSFHYRYDGRGPEAYCVRAWGDGGIYNTRFDYDKSNHYTVVTDSLGRDTTYHYNRSFLVTQIVNAHGGVTELVYDDDLRKVLEKDPLGRTTRWEHDERGNSTRFVGPDGAAVSIEHDERDQPILIRDARGETRFVYDAQSSLVERTGPTGDVTRYEWAHGLLRAVVEPGGARTEIAYDGDKNVTRIRDARRAEIRLDHDRRGRLVKRRDARGIERYRWDIRGRLAEMDDLAGVTHGWDWDAEDHVVSTGTVFRKVRFGYSGNGWLAWREEADGSRVLFEHDTEGQLVSVTNEAGERHRFLYSALGDVVFEVGFDGSVHEQRRELLTGELRAHIRPSGVTTRYERDGAGRIVKARHEPRHRRDGAPAEVLYRYGPDGLLEEATNATGTLHVTRDAAGRPIRESFAFAAEAPDWIESQLDLRGRRIGITSSMGASVFLERDPRGATSTLSVERDHGRSEPWRVTLGRDTLGQETERRLPGGIMLRWKRDTLGRPVFRETWSSTDILDALGYDWTPEGQLRQIVDPTRGTRRFGHDARERLYLETFTGEGNRTTFDYRSLDAVGNVYRTQAHADRKYGRGGMLLEASERGATTRYRHDPDGNLVERVDPDGARWQYRWSLDGMLAEVARPDGAVVAFAYDALGRRVEKMLRRNGAPTSRVRWLWDGHVPLHERTETFGASGEGATSSLDGGHGNVTTWLFEPETFAPLAKLDEHARYGIVGDHLGCPSALYDEAGELAWKAQLDVWGVAKTDVAKTSQPWRFPGQYEDGETGLFYNRFRYYDPSTGRYISKDPIGIAGGLPPFGYVLDPLVYQDPLGLICFPRWRLGGPITQLMPDGSYPSWGVIRERYWMTRAAQAAPGEFGPANLAAMRAGYPPSARAWVRSTDTGRLTQIRAVRELHHARANRGVPGFDSPTDLREVWPWEHAAIDPHRRLNYSFSHFAEGQ
ncbi:MAG: RHS domain-containing protein [Deltaproteobacteria bacterium]|nr:RHS domain-containing protein [Deltaproteobacteria bacterium]